MTSLELVVIGAIITLICSYSGGYAKDKMNKEYMGWLYLISFLVGIFGLIVMCIGFSR